MSRPASAFLSAGRLLHAVVDTPTIANAWEQPSVVEGFSVGSLTGHAYLALRRIRVSLDATEPRDLPVVRSSSYYGSIRVEDRNELGREPHQTILGDGQKIAAYGHDSVARRFGLLLEGLDERLSSEPATRLVPAPNGAAVPLDDLLATRTVEALVHADDLCVSVDVELGAIPSDSADLAIATLVDVVRWRAGDLSVLRALTRSERQPVGILRAL
jgi:hypothetical protein